MASLSSESPAPSVPAGGRADRIGRRRLARTTGLLVAGAVVGVEGLLSGCATSPAARSAVKPTIASNKVTLYYSAGGYESTRSAASLQAVQELLQTHFLAKHPSLDLRVNWNYHGNSSGLIASMIAGGARQESGDQGIPEQGARDRQSPSGPLGGGCKTGFLRPPPSGRCGGHSS